MSKKGEANKELERLFGPEEEVSLTMLQKFKLKMVSIQYKKEALLFRVFFDKIYRPERFNAIVNQMDSFNNINEFRTYVIQKYYKFPIKAAENIRFAPKKVNPNHNKEYNEAPNDK